MYAFTVDGPRRSNEKVLYAGIDRRLQHNRRTVSIGRNIAFDLVLGLSNSGFRSKMKYYVDPFNRCVHDINIPHIAANELGAVNLQVWIMSVYLRQKIIQYANRMAVFFK